VPSSASRAGGVEAIGRLLATGGEPVTAALSFNDAVAFGACDELFAMQREALALPYPGDLPPGPPPKKAFGS